MEAPLVLRPIRFPLKLKLISLFSLVLLTSLAAYAHYALTRFIEDKSAYIFSSVQEAASAQSRDITQTIDEAKRALEVMGQIEDATKVKRVFENFPSLVDYREYSFLRNDFTLGIADPSGLTRLQLERNQLDAIVAKIQAQAASYPDNHSQVLYPHDQKPAVAIVRKNSNKLQILQVSLIDVLSSRSDSIKTVIMAPDGTKLTPFEDETIFSKIKTLFLDRSISQGVIETDAFGVQSLVGIQTSNLQYPLTLAQIGKTDAFAVADNLIEKSYLFAIFLLSLAIIVGILFSRTLTKSLETLFLGTQSFVGGNFDSRVEVNSADEIGALSDSFNYMGKKIVEFMEEMKEKMRLEREVEVAKLVQDSFFPESEGQLGCGQFAAFYAPASECGGDWWGHIEHEGKTILFVADATGHGVPAALITATANCGLHTLKEVLKTNPKLCYHPEAMLEWFNKAICGAGKQLYMTMFCAVIDVQAKTIVWSNAAHNPALILPSNIENPKRQDLVPMLGNPSPHLGKSLDSKFERQTLSFNLGDTLILFTDGIVENTNTEKKAYGDRRFHQSIVEFKNQAVSLWRDQVAGSALEFSGGTPSDDDVTLILCTLGSNDVQNAKITYHSNDTVISNFDADEALDFLHANPAVNHLVGANTPRLKEELQHLPPSVSHYDFEWQGTSLNTFRDKLNHFLDTQEFNGWFESPRDYLRLIGDELVTNALDPVGTLVNVKLATDSDIIIVEVEDNRGALEKSTLLDSLKRARDTGAPKEGGRGAGLGLYLVYQSTNQIWIDVNKNKSTKVVCVLETTKRYKHFKGRLTSFHFVTQENS